MNGHRLYAESLSLLTDLYQLTMAYGYWKTGMADREAVFHLFFRSNPFNGGYAIAAGLETAVEVLREFRFTEDDIDYLKTLQGNDGERLFEADFLEVLRGLNLTVDIDAVPEGTVVFPHEPLVRVRGPILQCQLLETFLLNVINFQTLIATKASRICAATGGDPVLEFGLRRAQGIDGGISASRAAYIGGCAATSNVLAGKLYGIPVKGTHAHSWVMSFDSEVEAFDAYAAAMPNNCVFLVDTYGTISGIRNAIDVGRRLRKRGYEMVGIRLDSGDLATLSREGRVLLDEAGFPDAAIVASNDLNEETITRLKQEGAQINIWGVGTKLATAYDQPALGGVYKLSAIRGTNGEWEPRIKLSDQAIKVSNPGFLQVRRFSNTSGFLGDVIYDETLGDDNANTMVSTSNAESVAINNTVDSEDLLQPVFRNGKEVSELPTAHDARERGLNQLKRLPDGVRDLNDRIDYPVGLEKRLFALKTELIEKARR